MCLKINYNIKASRVNKDGYCVGYKVVEVNEDGTLKSYYRSLTYCIGDYISSRKSAQREENEYCEIRLGFHIFITRNEARKFKNNRSETRMIKVFYKPEDVVTYGTFGAYDQYKCVVVHKMSIQSLNAIR